MDSLKAFLTEANVYAPLGSILAAIAAVLFAFWRLHVEGVRQRDAAAAESQHQREAAAAEGQRQIEADAANSLRQRQATADGLYQRYLELAMQYPELASPTEYETPEPKDGTDYDRYYWLVAIMLNALSALIRCEPSEDKKAAMKADLIEHRHFFETSPLHDWRHYPPLLRALYDEAVKENPQPAPE
jgi:hypothetical protein